MATSENEITTVLQSYHLSFKANESVCYQEGLGVASNKVKNIYFANANSQRHHLEYQKLWKKQKNFHSFFITLLTIYIHGGVPGHVGVSGHGVLAYGGVAAYRETPASAELPAYGGMPANCAPLFTSMSIEIPQLETYLLTRFYVAEVRYLLTPLFYSLDLLPTIAKRVSRILVRNPVPSATFEEHMSPQDFDRAGVPARQGVNYHQRVFRCFLHLRNPALRPTPPQGTQEEDSSYVEQRKEKSRRPGDEIPAVIKYPIPSKVRLMSLLAILAMACSSCMYPPAISLILQYIPSKL